MPENKFLYKITPCFWVKTVWLNGLKKQGSHASIEHWHYKVQLVSVNLKPALACKRCLSNWWLFSLDKVWIIMQMYYVKLMYDHEAINQSINQLSCITQFLKAFTVCKYCISLAEGLFISGPAGDLHNTTLWETFMSNLSLHKVQWNEPQDSLF